jgi:lysophospholipase L1-like esterase
MTSIICIGDSITGGGKTFTCYRQLLVPAIRKMELDTRFTGPNEDSTSKHAGYGGRNTAYIRSHIQEIYTTHQADIVLLHSGHNSFNKDIPVPGIINDTEAIIKTIYGINPQVIILLAQVIPAGKLPKYSYIQELNLELAKLHKRLDSEKYSIQLINHEEGFNWTVDTIEDKVHPNPTGAKKMADKWMQALKPILEKKIAEL